MSADHSHRLCLFLAGVASSLTVGACSSIGESMRGTLGAVTPYKVEVQQGNFVSKEQVQALQAGMTRQQVREILGTPLLVDVFHLDRWDYVFTLRRQGIEPQQRRLTVFFNGEALNRVEGDAMPSEEEFVEMLDTRRRSGKTIRLEATEEELKKFAPPDGKSPVEDVQSLPPLPAAYPPLEASR